MYLKEKVKIVGKIVKYKIMSLLSDKIFLAMTIVFFLILNYEVLIYSGILSAGSRDFNGILKYMLLINNFITSSTLFGLLVAIYIGTGLIGKDVSSGQIYVMLLSYSKRWKYLIGNWIGLIIITILLIGFIILNYFAISLVLGIKTVYSDLFICFRGIFLDMVTIMTVTAVSSIFLNGISSSIVGIVGLTIFNIYSAFRIPFVNLPVVIGDVTRKLMVTFIPLLKIYAPSITDKGIINRYNIEPYIISNISLYQVVYITFLLILGSIFFKHKEL